MNAIHIPSTLKASVCVWEDLNTGQLDRLEGCTSADTVKDMLADIFNLQGYNEDFKMGIIVDLFYYTIQFAKENNMSKEQTSAFFSIVKRIHMANIDTPFGNLEAVYQYFKELLLCHSVNRPPYSIYIFSVVQVKLIITYVLNTYFRHFKLYKYAFTPKIRTDITFEYVGMPTDQILPDEEERAEDLNDSIKEKEVEEVNETKETEVIQASNTVEEQAMEDEEANDEKLKMKTLISSTLQEQLQQLKLTIDQQIKQNEEVMTSKIKAVEESVLGKSTKGSKGKRK